MKKSVLSIVIFSVILLIAGCTSQKDEELMQERRNYLSEFMHVRKCSFQENISPVAATKAVSAKASYIQVRYPIEDLPGKGIEVPDYKAVKTLNDLERIVIDYGAELAVIDDPARPDVIEISEPRIQTAMQPLVLQSKRYLYSMGLNEDDIAEMLEETEADESVLIPLTIELADSDIHYLAQKQNRRFSIIPNAYALSWGDAGDCALSALGLDVVMALNRSGAKALTKNALKQALKAVAKRCVGYIGVAIFVVDFGACLGSRA